MLLGTFPISLRMQLRKDLFIISPSCIIAKFCIIDGALGDLPWSM